MRYISTNPYDAFRPPHETRNTPDETHVVEVLEDTPVFSLSEAKNFLHVYHEKDDGFISRKIDAVTSQVEKYIRIDVIKKKRKSLWHRVPEKARLQSYPQGNILSVKLIDKHGNEQELTEGENFYVQGVKVKYLYGFNEFTGRLEVEYETGYSQVERNSGVCADIISAIEQEISLQYKNRQDPDTPAMTSVENLSLEARHLLTPIIRRAF